MQDKILHEPKVAERRVYGSTNTQARTHPPPPLSRGERRREGFACSFPIFSTGSNFSCPRGKKTFGDAAGGWFPGNREIRWGNIQFPVDNDWATPYCHTVIGHIEMVFHVDFKSGKPVYLQLVDQVCSRLASVPLRQGMRCLQFVRWRRNCASIATPSPRLTPSWRAWASSKRSPERAAFSRKTKAR